MKNKALVSLIVSMLIFGTVGIFRRYIPLPSGFVAFSRGIIGFVFLALFFAAKRQKFSFDKIKIFASLPFRSVDGFQLDNAF